MGRSTILGAVGALWLMGIGFSLLAGPPEEEEDHRASIRGLEIGMMAQDVLDRLGRMPDGRKDEEEEIIVYWKFEDGSRLQVNFRNDHVSHLALKYGRARPATDLWLEALTAGGGKLKLNPEEEAALQRLGQSDRPAVAGGPQGETESALTLERQTEVIRPARDPRVRYDYKVAETDDKKRLVWTREEDTPEGYRVQIRFLSTHRDELGDRFDEYVAFKYVSVLKKDLKKFEEAMEAPRKPS